MMLMMTMIGMVTLVFMRVLSLGLIVASWGILSCPFTDSLEDCRQEGHLERLAWGLPEPGL